MEPQDRIVRLSILLFIVSMIFAFWLISFDEFYKAMAGIIIINGWFLAIVLLNLSGKIKFLDEVEEEERLAREAGEAEEGRAP